MSVSEVKYSCPVEVTTEVVGGKWKCVILWWLRQDAKSFGELKQLVAGVNQKVLTQQLRELARDGLIHREAYREAPPRVEYSLTPYGETLRPITELMCEWGKAHMPGVRFGILRLNGLRILFIGGYDMRESLPTELQERGIEVIAVASANEALEMLSRVQPDALVVDTEVPNGDGYAFIRQVRVLEAQRRQIPAIALIPHAASTSDRRQAIQAGFQVRLAKPVEPAELVATLATLTGRLGLT